MDECSDSEDNMPSTTVGSSSIIQGGPKRTWADTERDNLFTGFGEYENW